MMSTAIPVSGAQTATLRASSGAKPNIDGQSHPFSFKDLLTGLHKGNGVKTSAPDNSDSEAESSETQETHDALSDLSASVVSDGNSSLPTVESTTDSSGQEASPQDTKSKQDCLCITKSNVEELQAVTVSPALEERVTKKSERKAKSDVSVKAKPSIKQATVPGTGASAASTVQGDVTMAQGAISVDGDGQSLSASPPSSAKISAGIEVAQKSSVGAAALRPNTSKLPVSIPRQVPQETGVTEPAGNVVACLSSSTDDQSYSSDPVAIETGTKAIHDSTLRESVFTAASVPQPSVVFDASLVRAAKSGDHVHLSEDASPTPEGDVLASPAASGSVSHLDLQWKDAALGNISVRAELRDSGLHAVVSSSHVSTTVSMTELHQFLEDNRIPVHSLQVNGVSEVKHIAGGGSFDTNTSAGGGSQASLSYRDESPRPSSRGESLRGRSKEEDEEASSTMSSVPSMHVWQIQRNRLSIHI